MCLSDYVNDFFGDFIKEIVISVIKSKYGEIKDAKKLTSIIETYLCREQINNFNVLKDEEVDFENLKIYLLNSISSDISLRFFGSKNERAIARENIVKKAIYYAKANTNLSEERVKKIVYNVIDIAKTIYSSSVPKELRFIANEVIDEINDVEKHINDRLDSSTEKIINKLDNQNPLSLPNISKLSKTEDFSSVSDYLQTCMAALDTKHTLNPYYGFKMNESNKLISYPKTKDAQLLYPEKFHFMSDLVELDGKKITGLNAEVLRKSFYNQLPIKIHVINAKKYLGDVLDPIQSEAKEMIGKNVILNPPAFPPAFPCAIYLDNEIKVPYLLLRTKKVLDNGSILLTNEEQQEFAYAVEITLSVNENRVSFSVTPNSPTNSETLKFKSFIREASLGKKITLKALDKNMILTEGATDKRDTKEIEYEIELLKKVVRVESYYNISICIPEMMTKKDEYVLNRMYDLSNGEIKQSWDEFEFGFDITDEIRQRVNDSTDETYSLMYWAPTVFSLWGTEITIPIVRVIYKARHKNLSRLKEKVNALDNGDNIKLVFVSEEGGFYIDRIKTGELEGNTLFFCDNE